MRVIIMFVLVSTIGSVFSQKTKTYNQHIAVILSEKGKLKASYVGCDSTKQHKLVSTAKDFIYTQLIDNIFPAGMERNGIIMDIPMCLKKELLLVVTLFPPP
jgi:hypothetical protein